jgi:sulfhydrogenase subunit beta (sulfur reductase)
MKLSDGVLLMSEAKAAITAEGLGALIGALAARGYKVIGPAMRDGAIVYDEISAVADLPSGWTERQEAGRYRLERREDNALFGYTVGPHSWKRFLHPPTQTLFEAKKSGDGLTIVAPDRPAQKLAFIGARSCEIHAIAIQDKVFLEGPYVDAGYAARRRDAFIVAVNCGEAGGTCFCVSMKTGPRAESGFDLALTELLDGGRHEFLIEAGSAAGAELLTTLPKRPATDADLEAAAAVTARTASRMGRSLDTAGLKEVLQNNPKHPQWEKVAARCLTCGNCTMACPTCFCTTVDDHSALDGSSATRVRKWDSCFTLDFSYIHGGAVRQSGSARYRQWMTHKLSSWYDQFGTSGCVGCGRCITWCPVGIDITQEAAAIRTAPKAATEDHNGGT